MAEAAEPQGWYADPTGRFEYRWWDGSKWTEGVSRGGVVAQDPLPPEPPEPKRPDPLSDAAVVFCFADRLFATDEGERLRIHHGQRWVRKYDAVHTAWAIELARLHDDGILWFEIADHHVGPVHTHPLLTHVRDAARLQQFEGGDNISWALKKVREQATDQGGGFSSD